MAAEAEEKRLQALKVARTFFQKHTRPTSEGMK